jgi:hypothetical protein
MRTPWTNSDTNSSLLSKRMTSKVFVFTLLSWTLMGLNSEAATPQLAHQPVKTLSSKPLENLAQVVEDSIKSSTFGVCGAVVRTVISPKTWASFKEDPAKGISQILELPAQVEATELTVSMQALEQMKEFVEIDETNSKSELAKKQKSARKLIISALAQATSKDSNLIVMFGDSVGKNNVDLKHFVISSPKTGETFAAYEGYCE